MYSMYKFFFLFNCGLTLLAQCRLRLEQRSGHVKVECLLVSVSKIVVVLVRVPFVLPLHTVDVGTKVIASSYALRSSSISSSLLHRSTQQTLCARK
jgi:hypothetical protein